jgi:hypothetical protein
MKGMLLAGILLLLAAPEAAQPQPVTLPDTIIGTWCSGSITAVPIYVRGCDEGERLTLRRDGYDEQDGLDGPHAYCEILKVKKFS